MKSGHPSPRDVSAHVTSQRVDTWLASLGLSCYTRAFLAHGYDVTDACRRISDADLTSIGVTSPQHRLVIYNAVERLRHDALNDVTNLRGQPFYYQLEKPHHTRAPAIESRRSAMTSPTVSSSGSSMSEILYDASKYNVRSPGATLEQENGSDDNEENDEKVSF